MGDNRFIKIAVTVALGAGLVTLGAGLVTLGAGLAATPASAQSLTDRFKSLFGGKSDEPAANAPANAPKKTAEPIRKEDSVGRNDPCPCGSGKKYKKCHGANAELP